MDSANIMLEKVGMSQTQIESTLTVLQHFTWRYIGRYEEMHDKAPNNHAIAQFQSGFLTAFTVAWKEVNGE